MRRGQATTFIVLGVVVLAVVVLILYLRGQLFFGPVTPEKIEDRMEQIRQHVQNCIKEAGEDVIRRIGLQGGYLSPGAGTYKLREDIPISYLCYNIPDDIKCYNRMLTLGDMEKQLSDYLRESLRGCVLNLDKFRRGITLRVGNMDVKTDIGREQVIVDVLMNIVLQKGEVKLEENGFSYAFGYPLGKLYDVSQDIVDVEVEFGEFDQLPYMLAHRGEYVIEKKRPYPDKLYILKTRDSDYVFQFFVQGEPA